MLFKSRSLMTHFLKRKIRGASVSEKLKMFKDGVDGERNRGGVLEECPGDEESYTR